MIAPQGIASFPGIGQLLQGSISVVHGISPSTAALTIAPQAGFPSEIGTLAFAFGETMIEFLGCRIDSSSFERNDRGEIWRLSIVDRRWRWRFGQISGSYNVRRDNATLARGEGGAIDTEKTPRELASLCLQAMGESDFDVADLPDDTRPTVEWNLAVPAEALAALCDELECLVILQLNNRVALRRNGQGAELSAAGALENSITVHMPQRPDAIAVAGGPHRYQVDFPLEAVGLESQSSSQAETLAPLDQLSYKPADGWFSADLPFFHQVDFARRALAQKSVFKYYRIKTPLAVPGYEGPDGNQVTRLEQILPIEDEQVTMAAENGQLANLPAAVVGVWYPDTGGVANSAATLSPPVELPPEGDVASLAAVYQRPYTIDTARGLVIFEEPVYRNIHPSANGSSGYEVVIGPAELVLRAACNVRDAETLEPKRFLRERQIGDGSPAATRYLRHEELVVTHTPNYSPSYALVDVRSNLAEMNTAADQILDIVEQQYGSTAPRTVRYGGLVPIELDGAIHQVHYSIGGAGATTTASRQSERARFGISHRERRRLERQHELEEARQRTSPRQLARTWKASPQTKPRPRT